MTAAGGAPIERDDLVRLAVAVVLHDRAGLARFARAHGGDAVEDRGLRETLLQCHLFCGVPRTIAALDAEEVALEQGLPQATSSAACRAPSPLSTRSGRAA